MNAKRFLVALLFLVLALSALATGVNFVLDRAAKSPTQSSFVIYDAQGAAVYSYRGNLASCALYNRPPSAVALPHEIVLHRT